MIGILSGQLVVGTCLCHSSGTSIPIKMLALRYLSRLLYRLDGWYSVWELPIEGTLWKNMSVKFSRLLVPKILLWSTGNSPPVPEESWPAVAAECFDTFVVDCEASEQWKTVSDWQRRVHSCRNRT